MTTHLRVWRRVRLLPGVTMNIGKRGASSFSFGRRGTHYTVGRTHTRATVGIPGGGIFLTDVERRKPQYLNQPHKPLHGQPSSEGPKTDKWAEFDTRAGVISPGDRFWLWSVLLA